MLFPLPSISRRAVAILCLAGSAAGQTPHRPQTPQPPFPYAVRDVTFAGGSSQIQLAGTLVLPKGEARAPAVILVPGAGAVDRDNAMMGHKPFLVMADYLARHGIASLRLDSRGIGGSTGSYSQATGDDLAADLGAAVAFLKLQSEVNPRAIGVIGHSQGGIVCALAAGARSEIRFVVLLAAPGLPDTELFANRIAVAGAAKGLPAAEIERIQQAFREARGRMLRGETDEAGKAVFGEVVRLMLPGGVSVPQAAIAAAIEQQLAAARSPNGAYFLAIDPRKTYGLIRCPVLAMNGTLDQNVPARENLAAIRSAFEAAGNRAGKTVEIAGLNHFFQTARSGSSMEAAQIEETLSPRVLELIVEWVLPQS